MLSKVTTCSLNGIDANIVTVEVDLSNGIPCFDLVGLPDSTVKESKERVRTAIRNSGFAFPTKRITVNLAPADTKKEGSSFDLPIAIGILTSMGAIRNSYLHEFLIAGELSLDGTIHAVRGVLPMVYGARTNGVNKCLLPSANAEEGALVAGTDVYGVSSLKETSAFLNHSITLERTYVDVGGLLKASGCYGVDFSDVKGQNNVRRALEVAASGLHNLLMIGPPGSGKTMMARRLPTILPDLTFEESIEITKIYSVANLTENKTSLITQRPFRAPHHTISYSALTGGGRIPKPGEISLSHNGILFLDELTEFQKKVLENLRQPMEDKFVTIARVNGTLSYPSNFMLVGSMNPCPCGYLGVPDKCRCSQNEIYKYLDKISGPLLDRIDLHVEAAPLQYNDLNFDSVSESSADIKSRVESAQKIQRARYRNENILFNSQLSSGQIATYCSLDSAGKSLLSGAFDRLSLSARAYHRILKVARTIADLDASETISGQHVAEAIQYRSLDRKYW